MLFGLLGLAGSLIGANKQAKAAKAATNAQVAASDADRAQIEAHYQQIRGDLTPARNWLAPSSAAYAYEMGMGPKPAGHVGYQETPDFAFQRQQGNDSINALAGARGGLFSGATLQALADHNTGVAQQGYGNYLSRLGGMVDTGLSAAQMTGNASQNASAGISNALSGAGNARAAGAIAQGNAWSNGINNALGAFQYQQGMGQQGGGGGGSNWLFGGNSFGKTAW